MTNAEICSAFLNHTMDQHGNPECTPKNSNMSYYGNNLYSYDTVLASIDRKRKILYIYQSCVNYSNTSAKQASILRQCVNYSDFKSWFTIPDHAQCSHSYGYIETIIKHMEKHQRANKHDYTINIQIVIEEATNYIKLNEKGYSKTKLNKIIKNLEQAFNNYKLWNIPYLKTYNYRRIKELQC